MENLTWTGSVGVYLNSIFQIVFLFMIIMTVLGVLRGFGTNADRDALTWKNYIMPSFLVSFVAMLWSQITMESSIPAYFHSMIGSNFLSWVVAILVGMIPAALFVWVCFKFPADLISKLLTWTFFIWLLLCLIYLVLGVVLPRDSVGIVGNISKQLLSVWISLIALFAFSISLKKQLGFYGKLFDNLVGMIGFGIVMFWVFTAVYSGVFGWIATEDTLTQVAQLKNALPGSIVPKEDAYPYYLLGGDNLGRDVFSRVVVGAWVVIRIAPLATLFAFMVGITLGLPAGYFGGRTDTILSFLANLILAFPVILLFYLLVTPEIANSGIPIGMAAVLFIFPLIFLVVLFNSRYFTKPVLRNVLVGVVVVLGGWLYLSMISKQGSAFGFLPVSIDPLEPSGGILIVFVSVVFVNAPTVFRIVRGLTMDVKSRDYVGAAQTRGERPWYIMLWEILPNVRGPLIVDFCLRIGYVTILLGTLGFFGLGLPPDSPDWGSTINAGRKLLSIYPYPALPPAFALMSLVLGLNLLADGLREESLKD